MWLTLGLFGGVLAILSGLAPLGVAGIVIGVICQISERKDEETWGQVQDTPVVNVLYPILSVAVALVVALVCFAILGLGLSRTM